jgi:hypothetical protein
LGRGGKNPDAKPGRLDDVKQCFASSIKRSGTQSNLNPKDQNLNQTVDFKSLKRFNG